LKNTSKLKVAIDENVFYYAATGDLKRLRIFLEILGECHRTVVTKECLGKIERRLEAEYHGRVEA